VGIHKWRWAIVFTKRESKHCRGVEEINHDKEGNFHTGRRCTYCQKEQYFWMFWVNSGYTDVLPEIQINKLND
jgi:hypothetical protein